VKMSEVEGIHEAWESWKSKHNKQYSSDDDHHRGKANYSHNHSFIEKHNAEFNDGKHSYKLGHNEYSDMLIDEFNKIRKGFDSRQQSGKHDSSNYQPPSGDAPAQCDWRQQGYVNDIQDQGQCGCCYAFSSVAAIEGQAFAATGQLPKLSEQWAMDCSKENGNNGCGGGTMDNVFKTVQQLGGIALEQDDSYTAKFESDKKDKKKPLYTAAQVTGFVDIPQGDENALITACGTIGPISIGIDASQQTFQLYKSGVYNDPNATAAGIDHAVVLVGYDSADGQDYYIVRNSWNTTWGQDGYVWMARNQNNAAGISSMASYPVIAQQQQ